MLLSTCINLRQHVICNFSYGNHTLPRDPPPIFFLNSAMATPSFSDLFLEVHHPSIAILSTSASHGVAHVMSVVFLRVAHVLAHVKSSHAVHQDTCAHRAAPASPDNQVLCSDRLFTHCPSVFRSEAEGRLQCNQGEPDCT